MSTLVLLTLQLLSYLAMNKFHSHNLAITMMTDFRGQSRWLVNTDTNLPIIGNVPKVSYMADIIELDDSEPIVGRLWQTITSLNLNVATQMCILPLFSIDICIHRSQPWIHIRMHNNTVVKWCREVQYGACQETDMVMIYLHINSSEVLRTEFGHLEDITCMH